MKTRRPGTGTIKNEVNKLAREFALVLFELFDVGRQEQSATSVVGILFVLAAHNFSDPKGNFKRLIHLRERAGSGAHIFCL